MAIQKQPIFEAYRDIPISERRHSLEIDQINSQQSSSSHLYLPLLLVTAGKYPI
jgi:hypothetical protein